MTKERKVQQTIELMPAEKSVFTDLTIKTVTFFTPSAGGYEDFEMGIRVRLAKIINANPWLVGRLIRRRADAVNSSSWTTWRGSKDDVALLVDTTMTDADVNAAVNDHFLVLDTDIVSSTSSPEQLLSIYATLPDRCRIKPKRHCILQQSHLFFLTLLINRRAQECCLLFSMSHVIADGRTYYDIYNMLSRDAQVKQLDPHRKIDVFLTGADNARLEQSALLSIAFFVRMAVSLIRFALIEWVWSPIWRTRKHHHLQQRKHPSYLSRQYIFKTVRRDWIESEKKKALLLGSCTNNEEAWVSTNDLLTSLFFRRSQATLGLMAIDLRGRIPEITRGLAGNYAGSVLYRIPSDYDTPHAIRETIKTGRTTFTRASVDTMPLLPSWWRGLRFCIVTNWSGFYTDIKVGMPEETRGEAAVVLRHEPLIAAVERQMGMLAVVIFASGNGDIKVVTNNADMVDDPNAFL